MSSAKKKEIAAQAVKPVSKRKTIPQEEEALSVEQVFDHWKEEVTSLQAQTFADEGAMVEAIVTRLIDRLKTPTHLVAPTKGFLIDLFITDPGLMQELRESLHVVEGVGK